MKFAVLFVITVYCTVLSYGSLIYRHRFMDTVLIITGKHDSETVPWNYAPCWPPLIVISCFLVSAGSHLNAVLPRHVCLWLGLIGVNMPRQDKQGIALSFLSAVNVRDFGMKKDQSRWVRVSICLRLFQREQ